MFKDFERMMADEGYRCMKCEGKNIKSHGRYCPKARKEKMEKKEEEQ